MDERRIQEQRRARLADAVRRLSEGNVAAFGRLLGYRGGAFVRQMLCGNRAVSDKTVRHIESLRGMHAWFSQPPAPAGIRETSVAYDFDAGPEMYELFPVSLHLRPGIADYAIWPDETDEDAPITFHRHWLERRGYMPQCLLAIRVRGCGMEPSIQAGDIVVVNTSDTTLRDGQVFAINGFGEVLLRRVQRDGGHWWLSCDNPDQARYPRKAWAEPDCIPIGRLVFKQSESI
ncbi:peptidase [Paracidovorax avenae]|uniref:S24 family peptidase n=1 Tax=Paracidovorax TaxID=3051137 RepID=UPI0002FF72C0|nr:MULTISPECIES: S24 family peptidase [Paracidovorax]AVS82772.1 peptidase [Paracidovorax avenae]AVS93169.1 peptidase [Paracidovorax avenae]AVT00526.1 peptidase [Paracidovorax avenae]AVT07588.1 peptidase [Paracidovorax avenae]AVT14273.1 peptidase [Paracidovorax avenae]